MPKLLPSVFLFLITFVGTVLAQSSLPAPDQHLTNAIRMAEARLRADRRDLPPGDLARLAQTLGRSNWLAGILVQRINTGDFTNAAVLLKEFPGTVNDLGEYGNPLLYRAVGENKEPQIRFLLEHQADPNRAAQHGQSPLHFAIQMRRWDIATLLLQAGASPTQTNRNHYGSPARELFSNWYPSISDETNRIPFLQQMLKHGFDPFLPMEAGQNPPVSYIENFLQRFARHNLNYAFPGGSARFSGFRPTPLAAPPGMDLCALLLTNQPDVNRRTPSGETALHLAAYWGRTNALAFLLAAGFSPDRTNAAGLAALQSIAGLDAGGQTLAAESIELLLARDAIVNVFTAAGLGQTNRVAERLQADPGLANTRDSFGRTPLHYAIRAMPPSVGNRFIWPGGRARVTTGPAIPPTTPPQLEAVTLLLNHDANPSAATTHTVPRISQSSESMPAGSTPLHLAAQRGHATLLRQLLTAKSSVTAADENGDTPLHLAARTGHSNSVHLLLLAKAPLDATNRAGYTPLRGAIKAGLAGSAAQLIAAGASLTNGVDDTTLLHVAARSSTVENTKLLRRHGLALDPRDGAGRTPFFRALEFRQWPNLTYLRREGANLNAADHDGNTPLHFIAAQQNDQIQHFEEQSWWVTWQREQRQSPGWRGKTINWIYSTKIINPPPAPAWTNTSLTLWLIKQGANVTATNRAGQTPLHALLSQSWVQDDNVQWTARITALLKAGARLDAPDTNGFTPLTAAVAANANPHLIAFLRKSGGDLNALDASGRTLLQTAIENARHDNGRVAELLALGLNPNATNRAGLAPMHLVLNQTANDWQRAQLVQILLSNGANPNLADRDGNTPLHYATNQKYELRGTLTLLITNGANPNLTNHAGDTPLHRALKAGNEHAARALVQAGADALRRDASGRTALRMVLETSTDYALEQSVRPPGADQDFFQSLRYQYPKSLDLWLAADPSLCAATNRSGQTPLLIATETGNTNLATRLLELGAPLDPLSALRLGRMEDFLTLLPGVPAPLPDHWAFEAVRFNRLDALQALMSRGADVNTADADGHSLWFRARAQKREEITQWLLTQGARETLFDVVVKGEESAIRALIEASPSSVSAPSRNGLTPLYAAASAGQPKATAVLLERGADPNLSISAGWTPLHAAIANDAVEIARQLLAAGAAPNAMSSAGMAPLHLAAALGATNVGALLIAQGADVNQLPPAPGGYSRNTPLHWAAHKGQVEMFKLLLAHGADLKALNRQNQTPMELARATKRGQHWGPPTPPGVRIRHSQTMFRPDTRDAILPELESLVAARQ